MPDDVALVGDLTLDLDALAVRLVRVAAPFADEFAARRASAKLERALYERVASFTTAFARGPGAGPPAQPRPAPPPRHTLVLPAAADVLAVVTDRPHAQIVGLFLRGDAPEPLEVFDPADADEARDVLKAVLPGALARAAAERLAARRRWALFGDARGVRTFARVPNGDDPASFFPAGTPGDAKAKEKVAAAVEFAASPTVFWRDDDDDDDDDDENDARSVGGSDDANAVAAAETRGGRTKPDGNGNDAYENRAKAKTHAFAFSSVRVFATRLARAAAPVVAANADAADADAASFATAAPLLREEALVVSLLDDPPPAYGHDSFEAFLEAFAAEYGVSLAALTRASDAYAASGKVGGSTLTTSPGKKHDGRVAEIRLRGDEERRLKRLWPSCLLLARHGATEVPARTARGDVASSLLAELVEDLNDEDARVPAPFGATLRPSFRAPATRSGSRLAGADRNGRDGTSAADGDAGDGGDDFRSPPFGGVDDSARVSSGTTADVVLRRASNSGSRAPRASDQVLVPAADLRRLNESACALIEADPPQAPAPREADDAPLASLPAAPAPAAPRPPPRRLAIPSAFAGNAPTRRAGAQEGGAPLAAASPVPGGVRLGAPPASPPGETGFVAEKENRAASPPRKKPRFASFKSAQTVRLQPSPIPNPTPIPTPARVPDRETGRPNEPFAREAGLGATRPSSPSPPPPPLEPPFAPAAAAAAAAAAEAERAMQAEILARLEAPVDKNVDGFVAALESPDAVKAELEGSFAAAREKSVELGAEVDDPARAARDDREARAAADAEAMPPPPPRVPAVSAVTAVGPAAATVREPEPAEDSRASAPPPDAIASQPPPKKKRAPAFSAFVFFSRAVRPTLAPGLSLGEQTRALGEKWRAAERNVKDAFAEEARRAKEAYLAEANEKARASERRSDPDPGPDPDLDPAAAPSPSREKKKRKAPPPPDPEAAEALLRERFEAEGGDVDAFSAFLKGKSVSSDALGAFLKKHEVPNVKRMKKEARVERAVAVLTRTHHPKASPSADAAS